MKSAAEFDQQLVAQRFEAETGNPCFARARDEIPLSYEYITDEWLTAVLCRDKSGIEVVAHTLGPPDNGNTNRRRIQVRYSSDVGEKLPTSIFCKASHELRMRQFLGKCALIQSEYLFYTKYRPLLDIETPQCLHCNYDGGSYNSIFVFDDLLRHGTEFCEPTTKITKESAKDQMALLAQLHGRFAGRLDLAEDGVLTFGEFFERANAMFDMRKAHEAGFTAAQNVIPEELFERRSQIWPAIQRSIDIHNSLPSTLIHSDVHLRNWYMKPNGKMGLSDWQNIAIGHWARDVNYTITTSISVENRRAWEADLLETYLSCLRREGINIKFSDAWRYYRQHMFTTFLWWTTTITMEYTQPKAAMFEFVRRIAAAIADTDALSSFS